MEVEHDQQLLQLGFNIIKHTDAMLSYWDKTLTCRFANDAYLRLHGKKPEEMIGNMLLSDLLGGLFENQLPYIKGVLAGKVQVFEVNRTLSSGKTKKLRGSYFPDFENGKVCGFYVHIIDNSPLDFSAEQNDRKRRYLTFNDVITKVEQTLRSCILTGFPGISVLSKMYFISESKLKRDFRETHNTSIFSYYRHLQMELAHTYLIEKKCNKNQMAMMLNFSNPSNFIACYKRFLNNKPQEIAPAKNTKESDRYKLAIEQSPVSVAMFNNDILFIAASKKWLTDFNLQAQEISGKSIYEIFPKTQLNFKAICDDCQESGITKFEDEFIKNDDGTAYWLRWVVTPWHANADVVNGIMIYAEDVTRGYVNTKSHDEIVIDILNDTNELMHIAQWTRDVTTNATTWSKTLKQILEVPDDFTPDIETAFLFYKEGKSRDAAKNGLKEVLTKGTPFDLEVDMITARGRQLRARLVVFSDFKDGRCEKISGVFHFISSNIFATIPAALADKKL